MSRVGDQLPPPRGGGGSGELKSDNKIYIPDATRLAEVVEVWVYDVDDKGRFTKDNTGKKKARVKFQFVARRDIVLDRRFPFYLGEKSHWSIFLQAVTGIPATKDTPESPSRQRDIDIDKDVLHKQVLVTTKYTDPYTDIEAVMRPPSAEDDFGGAPPHQPRPMTPAEPDKDEIRRKLHEALHNRTLLAGETGQCVYDVTGSFKTSSIRTPELALRVIEKINQKIKEAEEEIPW